jgi:hypothetical protein
MAIALRYRRTSERPGRPLTASSAFQPCGVADAERRPRGAADLIPEGVSFSLRSRRDVKAGQAHNASRGVGRAIARARPPGTPISSSSFSSRRHGLGAGLCRRPDRARGEVLWRPRRHRCSPPNAARLGVALTSTAAFGSPTAAGRQGRPAQSVAAPSRVLSRRSRSRADLCQPATSRRHGRRNGLVERSFCRLEVCQARPHARFAVRRKRGSGC